MAVESPPFALQGSTYGAEQTRRAICTMLQRGASIGSVSGGLVGSGDCLVTAGSGLQVLVAPGELWVPGTTSTTQSGMYCRVSSSSALAISASSESLPRIETIVAQVKDKAYAGGEENFAVAVVPGVATSGATLANKLGAGAVPASSLVLAYVLIAAKAIVPTEIENVAGLLGFGLHLSAAQILGLASALKMVSHASEVTASSGEVCLMTATATVNTPASPTATSIFGAICSAGTTTVKAATGKIFGDFLAEAGVTEVKLLKGQHCIFLADGTNWHIIAGEPKREQKYSALVERANETEYEPSATRDVEVVLTATNSAAQSSPVFCGGEEMGIMGWPATAGFYQTFKFRCPAGQKWKITNYSGGFLRSSYLSL